MVVVGIIFGDLVSKINDRDFISVKRSRCFFRVIVL